MNEIKSKKKHKYKPSIKTKNKSYAINDSVLYRLTTKKRLVKILDLSLRELGELTENSNYRVFDIKSKSGFREVQAPKRKLDIAQTRIASLLARITMPQYVHSGVKGRSNITNARAHIGVHSVLTLDIHRFYPSVTKKSIYHFFENRMLTSPDVAGVLANICTYNSHLPTGSRISMILAFWANSRMFDRLFRLSKQHGVIMSVYVDDLTFSGQRVNTFFADQVKRIIEAAGLSVHPQKTRLFSPHRPKLITGVIVCKDKIKVRNKHHKEIYTLIKEMKVSEKIPSSELQLQLIGKLYAAGQIDAKFKQQAVSLKNKW